MIVKEKEGCFLQVWRTNFSRPWLSLLILAIVFGASVTTIGLRLTPNNAPKVYLPPEKPTVKYHEKLKDFFPQTDITVGVFKVPDLLNISFLNKLDLLGDELKTLDSVDDVSSLTTATHIEPTEEGFEINPLLDIENKKAYSDSYWKERILSDRFAHKHVVNEKFSETALIIFAKGTDDSFKRLKLINSFKELVKKHKLEQYFIGVSGLLPQDTAQFELVQQDNARLIPLLFLAAFILIYFLYKSFRLLFFTAMILIVTVASSVSLYALFDKPFTSISSVTPSLLMALGTALLIHIYNFVQIGAKKGFSHVENIEKTFDDIFTPSFYIIITTAAGLLSLGVSEVPTVQAFGFVSALGVLFFYFITLLTLPGLLVRWGDVFQKTTTKKEKRLIDKIIDRLMILANHLSLRRPGWVILSVVILCLGALSQVSKIKVETNFLKFFDENHPININTKHVDENFFGTASAVVAFESDKLDRFKDAKFLKNVKRVHEWLDKQSEVSRTTSMVDFVEEMHKAFHKGQKAYQTIPDSTALITEYLFIYGEEDLYDFVNYDFNLAQLVFNTDLHNANDGEKLMEKLEAFLKTIDWSDDIVVQTNGHLKIVAEQENLLVQGQLKSIIGAILLICMFLILSTRSLVGGIICMIPNFSPVLFVFGCMGFLDIWLNMGTVLVASVVTGIAVDDTIHVYHSYRRLKEKGNRVSWALAKTTRETGRAITATTLILSVQFLLLSTSEFIPLSNFGLLAFVGLVSAWLFDILLLPALIILLDKKSKASLPS